jgi:hypothetical protein
MKDITKALVSLLVSFAVVMIPRGMRVTMTEFWLTPWLYGAPLLLLVWPVYLPAFRRMRNAGWWAFPFVGALIAPLPFLLLVVADLARGSERSLGAYLPWNSVFGIWYALFGAVLGSWVAVTRNRVRS